MSGIFMSAADVAAETVFDVRRCRGCGCSDHEACIDDFGQPCFWVEEDLCSECLANGRPTAIVVVQPAGKGRKTQC